jgi:hypothetical protein
MFNYQVILSNSLSVNSVATQLIKSKFPDYTADLTSPQNKILMVVYNGELVGIIDIVIWFNIASVIPKYIDNRISQKEYLIIYDYIYSYINNTIKQVQSSVHFANLGSFKALFYSNIELSSNYKKIRLNITTDVNGTSFGKTYNEYLREFKYDQSYNLLIEEEKKIPTFTLSNSVSKPPDKTSTITSFNFGNTQPPTSSFNFGSTQPTTTSFNFGSTQPTTTSFNFGASQPTTTTTPFTSQPTTTTTPFASQPTTTTTPFASQPTTTPFASQPTTTTTPFASQSTWNNQPATWNNQSSNILFGNTQPTTSFW